MGTGGRQWLFRHNPNGSLGAGSRALLSILPGGPTSAQIAAGSLSATNGTAVTCVRASNKYCRTAAGTLVLLSANQPAVEPEGLLVEGASTNLYLRSQAFDDAAWTNSAVTITPNTTVAPDGTTTAETIADTVGVAFHGVYQSVAFGSGVAVTVSTYVKAGTAGFLSIWEGSSGNGVTFDLAGQTAATTVGGWTGLVQSLGGGWLRVAATGTTTSAATNYAICVRTTNGAPNAVYSGTGSTVFLWQAQAELGSFVTSPILTAGASASRAGDVCSIPNPLTLASPWFVGATLTPEASATWGLISRMALGLGSESSANSFRLIMTSGAPGSLIASDYDAGAGQAGLINGSYSPVAGSAHRFIAGKTAQTTYSLTDNGSSAGIGTFGSGTGMVSQPASVFLGSSGAGDNAWGWLTNIRVGITAGSVA